MASKGGRSDIARKTKMSERARDFLLSIYTLSLLSPPSLEDLIIFAAITNCP
jgi:hypothetical protein